MGGVTIFAKTRHHYDSYGDFWRLVAAAGFEICYVDEIDFIMARASDAPIAFVFTPMNGEIMAMLPAWRMRRPNVKIVWWNLERAEDETLAKSLDAVARSVDAVWVSDRDTAGRDPRFSYVMMAGHPELGLRWVDHPGVHRRCYDVCPLSYLWGRRQEAIDGLIARGITIAPPAYGRAAQDDIVNRSHLILSLHQYAGMKAIAPLRFAVAASYAVPIISETYADAGADWLTLAHAPIEKIGAVVESALGDKPRLREAGQHLFERLCLHTDFRREVDRAVGEIP